MHIGIDARLITDKMAGIGQYAFNLYRYLKSSNRLKVTFYDDEHFAGIPNFSQMSSRGLRKIAYMFWLNFRFPGILKECGIDLIHAPNFVPPLWSGPPAVATFHDVGYLRYPHTHHSVYAAVFPGFANAAVDRAKLLIVPSKSSRDEMMHFYPRAKNKIRVIYQAATDNFKPIEDLEFLESVRKKYNLPERFILCVGTIEPRKNLERFVTAFKHWNDRKSAAEVFLVLCGKSWVRHFQFLDDLKASGISNRVILTGYIPNNEISAVYNLAEVLAFPSYYEGFGIPAVEAMSCGLPVISSKAFSLPEILEDAAVYFDPFSIGEMADAIGKVIDSPDLRKELSAKGLERARLYSWKKTAEMTEEVYREALSL